MACLTMSKLLLITFIIYAAAVSPSSSTSADTIRRRRAIREIDGWAINSHVRNRRHNNERLSTLDDKTLSRLRAGGGGVSKTSSNREQAEVSGLPEGQVPRPERSTSERQPGLVQKLRARPVHGERGADDMQTDDMWHRQGPSARFERRRPPGRRLQFVRERPLPESAHRRFT